MKFALIKQILLFLCFCSFLPLAGWSQVDTLYFEMRDAQDMSPVKELSFEVTGNGKFPLAVVAPGKVRYIHDPESPIGSIAFKSGGYITQEFSPEERSKFVKK